MSGFWEEFEKRAYFVAMTPLKSQAAKDEYHRESKNKGTLGGAALGGLTGFIASSGSPHGKHLALGTAGGAALGAGLGRYLGHRRGKARGEKGYAEIHSGSFEGIADKAKKYHELNKQK